MTRREFWRSFQSLPAAAGCTLERTYLGGNISLDMFLHSAAKCHEGYAT